MTAAPSVMTLLPDNRGWLTIDALNGSDPLSAALILPIPPGPAFELLEAAYFLVVDHIHVLGRRGEFEGLCHGNCGLHGERATKVLVTWPRLASAP
jgi:hypothetical protein